MLKTYFLLGKLHIQGKTQWDLFEKASYIHKMSDENDMTPQEIGAIVGLSASEIKTQDQSLRSYAR